MRNNLKTIILDGIIFLFITFTIVYAIIYGLFYGINYGIEYLINTIGDKLNAISQRLYREQMNTK